MAKPKKTKKQAKVKSNKKPKARTNKPASKKSSKSRTPQQDSDQKVGKVETQLPLGHKNRVSIQSAIYDLFEKKGCDNVMVEEAILIARAVKPDTKFDRWHLYFHRKNWRRILVERAIARRKEMLSNQSQKGN